MMLSVAPVGLMAPPKAEPFVLLVDDHEPSLVKLCQVVESAGHACVALSSGPEALAYCDACRPSLVVTDLAMPRLDGHALACRLKPRYPSLPILLLTGEMIDSDSLAVLRRTFDAVLTKPLEVEPFLTLLDDLMPRGGAPRP